MREKQPINRIEEIEADFERYRPMLEEMYLEYEVHRKAHDLTAVGVDPALNPVPVPEPSPTDGAD